MAYKARLKLIQFAKETTYGVDAIAAAEPATYLQGSEFSLTPIEGEDETLAYDDGKLGNSPSVAVGSHMALTFKVDWVGSGAATTPALYSKLLQACLRGETVGGSSVTHAIAPAGSASLTFYFWIGGERYALLGARGSFKLMAEAKKLPRLEFNFLGLLVPATAEAQPSGSFTGWQRPLPVGVEHSSCTLGGVTIKLISLEYDQANALNYQEYVGHQEILISNLEPSGKIVFEKPPIATLDPVDWYQGGDELTLSFTHGPSGRQVRWTSTRVQLGKPTFADLNGTLTWDVPIRPLGESDQLITQ